MYMLYILYIMYVSTDFTDILSNNYGPILGEEVIEYTTIKHVS